MKSNLIYKIYLTIFICTSITIGCVSAQDTKTTKRVYSTTGGEIIFSWADANSAGTDITTITRFSPVVNIQSQLHRDMNDNVGFFTGLSLRNVGFIFNDPYAFNTKYKARSYTLGIPVAVKLGNMDGFFFFGGYELEFPFNYKEKKFVNDEKIEKNSYWFSNRTPSIYQSYFAGIQTTHGFQLKFKYYFTNFFNKNYSANDGSGNVIYPYQNLNANVFYVSLSFQILKGAHLYYSH